MSRPNGRVGAFLRELLGGPARLQDLKDGLPGIATNLLTERLRRMEGDGIVRRPGGAGSGLYALTDAGESIRTAIEELGMWGVRMAQTMGRVAPPVHERSIRAIAMAMQSILVRAGDALPTETRVIELDIDGEPIEIVLGRRPSVTARTSMQPSARVRSTSEAISSFLLGSPVDGSTFEHVSGDPDATRRLIGVLGGPANRFVRAGRLTPPRIGSRTHLVFEQVPDPEGVFSDGGTQAPPANRVSG